jgi:LemA protein
MEIGNQLKRQAELLPNLAEVFKGAKKQEKEIFKMLTDARKTIVEAMKSGSQKAIDKSQETLQKALEQVRITVESNPQIQSISTLSAITENLRDTADKIMYARRVMIDLSADYNIMLVTFPSSLVANLFSFKTAEGLKTPVSGEFLEVSDQDTKTPKIDLEN